MFSNTYKTMVASFETCSVQWYPNFKKLTTTSAIATLSAFDEGFITMLKNADLYHYTFAPLAGLARLIRDASEEQLLETEDVLAHDMHARRPEGCELIGALIRVANGGDVVRQRIEPDVHDVAFVISALFA